jgi:hypothetical protein
MSFPSDAHRVADVLLSATDQAADRFPWFSNVMDHFYGPGYLELESYEDAGVLTHDAGFVVKFPNGATFQVTVVQSAPGTDYEEDEDDEKAS